MNLDGDRNGLRRNLFLKHERVDVVVELVCKNCGIDRKQGGCSNLPIPITHKIEMDSDFSRNGAEGK